ncbi:MAG: hypothetical protein AB7G88_03955 [Thermomicrobiales bacterium]
MSDPLVARDTATAGRLDRSRMIAWLLLGTPLVVYALFWPVRARLDQGVIERHSSWSIWRRMTESLPRVGTQTLFEMAFLAGLVLFVGASLLLIWLALDRSGSEIAAEESVAGDLDPGPVE